MKAVNRGGEPKEKTDEEREMTDNHVGTEAIASVLGPLSIKRMSMPSEHR